MSIIAYNNIEIKPYKLNSFQDLKIVKKLNEHGTIYFKGIVPEEEKDKYVEMTEVGTNLEVDCIDEASNRIRGCRISIKNYANAAAFFRVFRENLMIFYPTISSLIKKWRTLISLWY